MTDEAPSALYLARRAQAKARDVRDGEISIDGLIKTIDQLAELLSEQNEPQTLWEYETEWGCLPESETP